MPNTSLFAKAGNTFSERKRKVARCTEKYHDARQKATAFQTVKELDKYESNHGLLDLMACTGTMTGWTKKPLERSRGRFSSKPTPIQVAPKPKVKPPVKTRLVARPSSPLGLYNYGKMSLRALSVDSLQPHQRGEVRLSDSYAVFPSAPLGGYPWSMQEPCLMQPSLEPMKPFEGLLDTAPLRRAFSHASLVESSLKPVSNVRSNRAQDLRSQAKAAGRAHEVMQSQLDDQVSWMGQHGYSWKDRCDQHISWLDQNGRKDDSAWLEEPRNQWDEDQQLSFDILSGLHDELRRRAMTIRGLFKFIDTDASEYVEPNEFLNGLRRLYIKRSDALTKPRLIHLLKTMDSSFDGRVSMPELQKIMCRIARLKAEERKTGATVPPGI
eukprot:TRINITY_DN80703_c0_g1_i1.p1 TRINITY_DN80703_c0_g1~~TRINITY_DN80703_c0_g1_i1.p1  ORF type:complete len:382 (-),score=39.29 TRINITY_DN80703_c0_g1_i1:213-1358(-)